MIRLSSYGRREWGMATMVALLALLVGVPLLGWSVVLPIGAAWLAVAGFFRDPDRVIPDVSIDTMLSPADGKVSAIEHVRHHEATDGQPAVVIRIFLSVLNVHINRAPCHARVVRTIHRPGQYLDARRPESARVNESNLLVLVRSGEGVPAEHIGVKQISGAIARRIVCRVAPDQPLEPGQQYGMIKFGSTTELILPRPNDVKVLVKVGDRVQGGLTALAWIDDDPRDSAAAAPAPVASEG